MDSYLPPCGLDVCPARSATIEEAYFAIVGCDFNWLPPVAVLDIRPSISHEGKSLWYHQVWIGERSADGQLVGQATGCQRSYPTERQARIGLQLALPAYLKHTQHVYATEILAGARVKVSPISVYARNTTRIVALARTATLSAAPAAPTFHS